MTLLNEASWDGCTVHQHPFLHSVVDDALQQEAFRRLEGQISEIPDANFERHPTGYLYATLLDVEFIKFLYSSPFLARLGKMFGRPVRRSERYRWPQVYFYPEHTKGLPPHTDGADPRDIAVIFYMASGWRPDAGGEFNLLSAPGDGSFTVERSVRPLSNTAACIELNASAWHSVSPTHQGWRRKTIIGDYDFV